jgi:tetratricopeptide (TPR) repeat protein
MKLKLTGIILIFLLLSGCTFTAKNSSKDIHKKPIIPKQAKLLLDKGINEIKYQEYQLAIKELTELTRLYPKLAIGHYNLGIAYIKNDNINEAIKAWQTTVSIDNKYADAYFNLGKVYKQIDKRKSAEYLQKYITLRPDDPYINVIKDEITEMIKSQGLIKKVSFGDKADFNRNIVINIKEIFNPETPVIYSCIEFKSKTVKKNIELKWYYIMPKNDMLPVNSAKFAAQGSNKVIASLKKPVKGWPIGQYKLIIFVENEENTVTAFEIQR